MDLSIAPTASPDVPRLLPRDRRAGSSGGHRDAPASTEAPAPAATDVFDSAAPVSVGADTEAAVAELAPVGGVPLTAAIRRYGESA